MLCQSRYVARGIHTKKLPIVLCPVGIGGRSVSVLLLRSCWVQNETCIRRACRTPPPAFVCAPIGPRAISGPSSYRITLAHPPTAALPLQVRKSSLHLRPHPCARGDVPCSPSSASPRAPASSFLPLATPYPHIGPSSRLGPRSPPRRVPDPRP